MATSTKKKRRSSTLPGFRLSLGFTLFYLVSIVLLPLVAILLTGFHSGTAGFLHAIRTPRVIASCRVTLTSALLAALLSAVFGMLVAWVLARYRFPGHSIVDALIDLPFALPTAVAGIALTSLYTEDGWVGRYLEPHNIHIAFSQAGIVLAMAFVGSPFVVRSIQPVLEDLDHSLEEAARSLGASHWQIFTRVLLPLCLPALLTGTALAFARAAGEYGSVIFIAGNMPMKTEIAALLIVTKLEEYDYTGASAIALAMLALSFVVMLAINLLQWAVSRREGKRI
ncbi:sulfate ABC transporter permease subunit CysT [Telmatobacter bradus]|uniref:sulfate ABC transporter permease subunit CysT n=1 Tax=Telmatobacter bradus TaxID=474953 RepID=UPI003B42EAC8